MEIAQKTPEIYEEIRVKIENICDVIEDSPYYSKNRVKLSHKMMVIGALKLLESGFYTDNIQIDPDPFVKKYIITTKQYNQYGELLYKNTEKFKVTSDDINKAIKQTKICLS